jgi:putative two-component system response regulator
MASHHLDILVVEDDGMLRRVMVLQLAHFAVRTANNGAEALKLIAEHVPSVLVIDVGLPDMTGLEVIEKLRQDVATRSIPVIVHTTLDLSKEQQAQFKLGPTKCITKTTAFSDRLSELILELLEEQKHALKPIL